MFELIRANKRRSVILVFVMLLVLLALGFLIGAAVVPSVGASRVDYRGDQASIQPGFAFDPTGGFLGMGVAFFIWMIQSAIAYFAGGRILLSISGAREIKKEDHPQLFNVVEEMTIAARLPKMPRVFLIDNMALNAFATGRSPDNAAVAVTAGLLGKLDRDQLQGVIAHEISHIVHRDVLFMTMVGIMLGTIVMISEVFLRSLWYSSATRRYRSSSRREGGGAQMILMVVAIVFAILAPIIAQLIYFAVSRRREYLADAGAAVYTRYPEGLAGALEVLARDNQPMENVSRATAPMYIVNPLNKMSAAGLMSTHPPLQDRIKVLRCIAGGVSYADYQTAWSKALGKKAGSIPASALASKERAPLRKPSGKSAKAARRRMREAGDLLRNVNDFLFLACVCGMRVKLPPDFKKDHVDCPRCKRTLQVPVAQLAAIGAIGDQLTGATASPAQGKEALTVTRHGREWMSFKCRCGAMKNLSPSFTADHTTCTQCGRSIQIVQG